MARAQLDFTSEQWNAGEALEDFGLVQLGKRLYDPALGRFLSRDPLLIPRTAATTNPYSFALNDPINLSDPSGMDPDPINGGAICASNGGSQSSDGSAVAAGLLAGKLTLYFDVKIGSWFTSSFDQAAFNAARDMQMAMIQLATTDQHSGIGDLVSGFGDGLYDAGAGMAHMVRHPIDTAEGIGHAIAHPIQTGEAIGRSIRSTGSAIMSGDMHALGHAVAGLAVAFGPGAAGKVLGELGGIDAVAAIEDLGAASRTERIRILFHGTDDLSAADIVTNKLNPARAAELGGGDIFWTTAKRADSEFYAAANPASRPAAIVRISVPESVITTLQKGGRLIVEETDYKFPVGRGWNALNDFATFTLEK